MKFTASSADLLKALTSVAGAVPSKSTLPILECILFERDGDALRMSATDLEISIVKRIGVQFETNGTDSKKRIAVPAKRLVDTLRALPDLPITFASDEQANVTLQTDQGRYKMVGYDGADYPAIPELAAAARVETESLVLRRAIQKTSFAVSRDDLRPAMMGIYFSLDAEKGRIVATDGHRLVRLTMTSLTSATPIDFIVPEKAVRLAERMATEGLCSIAVENGYVAFDFSDARVIARLIDETYPNYEAVIPRENDRTLTVNRDALLSTAKRVGLYSSSMTNQIRLDLQAERVKVSAEDIERSSEAHETVLCEYNGPDMMIGFNSIYLNEVLGNIDSDDVAMTFSTPNRAGVVTPQDQASDEEMLMLIMPVMLNTYA